MLGRLAATRSLPTPHPPPGSRTSSRAAASRRSTGGRRSARLQRWPPSGLRRSPRSRSCVRSSKTGCRSVRRPARSRSSRPRSSRTPGSTRAGRRSTAPASTPPTARTWAPWQPCSLSRPCASCGATSSRSRRRPEWPGSRSPAVSACSQPCCCRGPRSSSRRKAPSPTASSRSGSPRPAGWSPHCSRCGSSRSAGETETQRDPRRSRLRPRCCSSPEEPSPSTRRSATAPPPGPGSGSPSCCSRSCWRSVPGTASASVRRGSRPVRARPRAARRQPLPAVAARVLRGRGRAQ